MAGLMGKPAENVTSARCCYSKIICRCLSLPLSPVLSLKRSTPNLHPDLGLPEFFFFSNPTTESLLTLIPSLSPPHLSIIVTLPLIHQQLSFLLAPRFRQPIYTVAGYIYLLEVWGALPSPPLAPWRAHSRTCSCRLSVSLSKPFCITSGFEFGRNSVVLDMKLRKKTFASLWQYLLYPGALESKLLTQNFVKLVKYDVTKWTRLSIN